MVTLFLCKA